MKTPKSATDIKVGGKTPEEIKKGLECCSISHDYCGNECPYKCYANGSAKLSLLKDSLTYIQQLESLLVQAERERDAAVKDLKQIFLPGSVPCDFCENDCRNADAWDDIHYACFEWRGVWPENTKGASTMDRFKSKEGVELWSLGERKYSGMYREMGESKKVAEIHDALQDIVNKVNDTIVEVFGKEQDGCEVVIKILPSVVRNKDSVFDMMADPLKEDRVYMTIGYKAWIETKEEHTDA